ncbi:hypothetical protein NGUA15_04294 [Salmonella enterica]|nr:hypothetical protein NGUA15_04294 [Salmonella enterica]
MLFRIAEFMREFREKPQSQHLVMRDGKTGVIGHFGNGVNNKRG